MTLVLLRAESAEELIRHIAVEFDWAIPVLLANLRRLWLNAKSSIDFVEILVAEYWITTFKFFYL